MVFGFFILVLTLVGVLSESFFGAAFKILGFALVAAWVFFVDAYVIVFVNTAKVTFYYPLRPWKRNIELNLEEISSIREGYRSTLVIVQKNGKEVIFTHAFFPSETKKIIELLKQKIA